MKYSRSFDELKEKAVKWWSPFLTNSEGNASVIPKLIETQDTFLSILKLSGAGPQKYLEILKCSRFPANLFLKHLVVLSDFGGEPLQRMNRDFPRLFSQRRAKYKLDYIWGGQQHTYVFKELPISGTLNNAKMKIDGHSVVKAIELNQLTTDISMILMHGSTAVSEETASILSKCEIGGLLGKIEELEKYIKERYIHVSRITGGAQANTLGQIAQTYVVDFLKRELGEGYKIEENGHIEGVTQNAGRTLTTFDIVVSKGIRSVAVEISFQVTTNSTIERKSGQAAARLSALHEKGHFIAYVLDGAGNFQRQSALSSICAQSDCTVAYSDAEFTVLVSFIRERLG